MSDNDLKQPNPNVGNGALPKDWLMKKCLCDVVGMSDEEMYDHMQALHKRLAEVESKLSLYEQERAELLVVCKLALKDLKAEMVWGPLRDRLEAVIAKAEGRPSNPDTHDEPDITWEYREEGKP